LTPFNMSVQVQALEQKLQELQESVNSGGSNAQAITKEITVSPAPPLPCALRPIAPRPVALLIAKETAVSRALHAPCSPRCPVALVPRCPVAPVPHRPVALSIRNRVLVCTVRIVELTRRHASETRKLTRLRPSCHMSPPFCLCRAALWRAITHCPLPQLIQGSLKLVDDGMKAQAAEVSALTKSVRAGALVCAPARLVESCL